MINPKDATLFFDMSASIGIKNLHRLAPFHKVETLWAVELGLPAAGYTACFSFTLRAPVTLRHFNVSQNLVMQMRGTKRWTVVPYDTAGGGYPKIESGLLPDDDPLREQLVFDVNEGDIACLLYGSRDGELVADRVTPGATSHFSLAS